MPTDGRAAWTSPRVGSPFRTTSRWAAGGTAGGITKLGSKRLTLQGDGTYTGPVDIKESVLRIQNDTALGTASGGTTVENGTALEVYPTIPQNAGGLQNGLQVWGEPL